MSDTQNKIAVLLLNMGGPERVDDVRSFLYRLFSDNFIVELPAPFLLQKPFAWLISTLRYKNTMKKYAEIGGGSPQLRIVRQQADSLAHALRHRGHVVDAWIGMSYTHPLIHETLDEIRQGGYQRLICLSLYPHECRATTGSVFYEIQRYCSRHPEWNIRLDEIRHYPLFPSFIRAWAHAILHAMQPLLVSGKPAADIHLNFSAHSVPMKLVRSGDPYVGQVEDSIRAIVEAMRFPGHLHLSWQSRVGPVEWQGPQTLQKMVELARLGVDHVVMVPISFTSDHIETLHEMDVEIRAHAEQHGLRNFIRVPALNHDPLFIQCLADLVEEKIKATHD